MQNVINEKIANDYLAGAKLKDLEEKYHKPSSNIIELLKRRNVFVPSSKRWTEDELQYLRKNYASAEWPDIFRNLDRWSKEDITTKAYKLKVHRDVFFWSSEDITLLNSLYANGASGTDMVDAFDSRFSVEAIYTKAHKLGICTREKWSDEEIDILKNSYSALPFSQVQLLLPNRPAASIKTTANSLGIKSKFYLSRKWTPEMDKYLIDNWERLSDVELGNKMHRDRISIKSRRYTLNLCRETAPGTYTYLYEFLRKRNKQWKKDSAAKCKYKCVATGGAFNEIHHPYGMNLILNEALEYAKIDLKPFDEYSSQDLGRILEVFLETQKKYPLGICLAKSVHKSFHDKYGYGNNTPDQFDNFLSFYTNNIA